MAPSISHAATASEELMHAPDGLFSTCMRADLHACETERSTEDRHKPRSEPANGDLVADFPARQEFLALLYAALCAQHY